MCVVVYGVECVVVYVVTCVVVCMLSMWLCM